jgi:hypothetical protein
MSPKVWNRSRAGPYDSACTRETSSYVSMTAPAYVCIRRLVRTTAPACTYAYVSIRQHASACWSVRQRLSAYVSIRQHTSDGELVRTTAPECTAMPAYASIRQHMQYIASHTTVSLFTCIREHTSAYVSIRQHMQYIASHILCRPLECLSMCTKRHRNVYRLKRGDFGGTDNVDTAPDTQLLRC